MVKKKEVQNPLATLIENVQKDQDELKVQETKLLLAKEAKLAIAQRLRDYRKDLSVLMKYGSDEQKEQFEELGLELSENGNTLNPTSQLVLDIMTKKKKLTNEVLYEHYVKVVPKEHEPLSYTQLNIKIRPLFNRNLLIREKGADPNSSKTDVIRLKR